MPNILILEDDLQRIERFVRHYKNSGLTVYVTDQVNQCIELLQNEPIDLIYLDHDLGGKVMVDPTKELTGLHVAQWMVSNPSRAPKIAFIHSHNPIGSKAMHETLIAIAEMQVFVAPFPACLTQYQVQNK
jgi:CheY-like chemotaxis protein